MECERAFANPAALLPEPAQTKPPAAAASHPQNRSL
jgi:hypothetical protein